MTYLVMTRDPLDYPCPRCAAPPGMACTTFGDLEANHHHRRYLAMDELTEADAEAVWELEKDRREEWGGRWG